MKSALFFTLLLSFSATLCAQTVAVKIPQSTHKTCQLNPKECLNLLPELFQQIPTGSLSWFKLKNYQMWAQYLLADYDSLNTSTFEAINAPNPPGEFEFITAIYRVKYLLTVDKDEEAFKLMQRAKKLFAKLDSTFSDPTRLIVYANLIQEEAHRLKRHAPKEVYRAKFLESRNVLLKIRNSYKNLNDPDFQSSLYANLGHTAASLDNYVKYLEYRSKGLFWAKQTKNPQRIGVSHYNLARAYQANRKYEKAIVEYRKSIKEYEKAEDTVGITLSQLRIAQNHIELGNLEVAEALMAKLAESKTKASFKIHHEELFNELKAELSKQ